MVPRDEQMKRLSASRKAQFEGAQQYYLFTQHKGKMVKRLQSSDYDYLNRSGKNWVKGGFCEDYKISAYESGA